MLMPNHGLLLTVVTHSTQPQLNKTATQTSKRCFRVVIDPGHGGHDTGAISQHGLREKMWYWLFRKSSLN